MTMERKIKESQAFFDFKADSYDTVDSTSGNPILIHPLIVEKAMDAGYANLVDIGCGTGIMLEMLWEVNPRARLVGVDLSDGMLEIARKRLGERARLLHLDASRLPFGDGEFDVVTCNHAFHHFPNPLKVLVEWRRVLREGGLLVIGENWRAPLERFRLNLMFKTFDRKGDVRFYSQEELEGLLEGAGFTDIRYERLGDKNCIVQARNGSSDAVEQER